MKRNHARGRLCALAICGLIAGCDSIFASYLVYPDGGTELGPFDPNAPVCGDRDQLLCLRFEQDLEDESPKRFSPLDPRPDVAIVKDAQRGLVGSFGQMENPKPFRLKHDAAWELTEYSFDAWVYPAKGPAFRHGLIDRSLRFGVFLYPQSTSTLWMACGLHDRLATGPTVPIGQWSHLACVVSAAKVDFYVDGQFTNSVPFLSVSPVTQTIETFVGSNEPDGADAFTGMLDELRLFKRLRTAQEIAADATRRPTK
jgi:hypothetical protein